MVEQRKVRRVKKKPDEEPRSKRGDQGTYLERWGGVVRGIVELDVDEVHSRLEASLREESKTGTSLMKSLDRVAYDYAEACKLRERARYEYELFKLDYEEWLEAKRTASRRGLQELKKEKKLTGTITEKAVSENVIATWPDEYRRRTGELKRFEAAVETLRKLPDAFQVRARALQEQKDLLMKLGTGVSGGG